jgi:hypothetical protein
MYQQAISGLRHSKRSLDQILGGAVSLYPNYERLN